MKTKTIVGALGIIEKEGKFLLGLRYEPNSPKLHHKWEFPGGEVEPEETPAETVVREVKEEVGVDVEVKFLIPHVVVNFWEKDKQKTKVILLPYYCELKNGKPHPANYELEEVGWFDLADLEPSMCLPGSKEIIQSVLQLKDNA
jgi:8-oxo-dGTP diphosphatase